MDFLLATTGSAGDVYPFLTLGRALAARGAEVALAAPGAFRPRADAEGLSLIELEGGGRASGRSTERLPLGVIVKRGIDLLTLSLAGKWRKLARSSTVVPLLGPAYDLIARHHVPGRTVVVASGPLLGARIAHDRLGVPLVTVHLSPWVLRSAHRAPLAPPLRLPGWLPPWAKRGAYRALDSLVLDPLLAGPVNRLRREVGLPPVRRVLHEWRHSPQLVLGLFPSWFAAAQPDWPAATRLTGFLRYRGGPGAPERARPTPADLSPPDACPPLLVFTPGSAVRRAHRFFEGANQACARLGLRGLFLTPFREQVPARLAAGVRHLDYAPLHEVLPFAAALIHTGGIGTSAEGLAAGVPQVVMPLKNDQAENASRLAQLGVAAVLPPHAYGAAALVVALRALLDSTQTARRCREVARWVAADDALAQTCRLIEERRLSRGAGAA
jgi:rhamnosyltransferase subunit B